MQLKDVYIELERSWPDSSENILFHDAVQVLNILKIGDSSVRSTCTSDKTSLN